MNDLKITNRDRKILFHHQITSNKIAQEWCTGNLSWSNLSWLMLSLRQWLTVRAYMYLCVHVFSPKGKLNFTLKLCLVITSSDCDIFLAGKYEIEKDSLFTKRKQAETRYIYIGLKMTCWYTRSSLCKSSSWCDILMKWTVQINNQLSGNHRVWSEKVRLDLRILTD